MPAIDFQISYPVARALLDELDNNQPAQFTRAWREELRLGCQDYERQRAPRWIVYCPECGQEDTDA